MCCTNKDYIYNPNIKEVDKQEDNPSFAVVDFNTGEVIKTFSKGRVIEEKDSDYKNRYKIGFNNGKPFVKTFTIPLQELCFVLDMKELSVTTGMVAYISYEDGIIRDNDGNFLTLKRLSELIGFSYSSVKRAVPSLIEKGVVKKIKVVSEKTDYRNKYAYVLNPYLFLQGKDIRKDILYFFEDTTWSKK